MLEQTQLSIADFERRLCFVSPVYEKNLSLWIPFHCHMVLIVQKSTSFPFHQYVRSNTISKGHLNNGANFDLIVQVLLLFHLFLLPYHISFFGNEVPLLKQVVDCHHAYAVCCKKCNSKRYLSTDTHVDHRGEVLFSFCLYKCNKVLNFVFISSLVWQTLFFFSACLLCFLFRTCKLHFLLNSLSCGLPDPLFELGSCHITCY